MSEPSRVTLASVREVFSGLVAITIVVTFLVMVTKGMSGALEEPQFQRLKELLATTTLSQVATAAAPFVSVGTAEDAGTIATQRARLEVALQEAQRTTEELATRP